MSPDCIFCRIVQGCAEASIVCEDALAMAFVDRRQFLAGHALVVPRRHVRDVRELDRDTGAALMAMVSRVTRAVGRAFPNQGLSVWHSIGEGGGQEVQHLHFHVHPRMVGDGLLVVYPRTPAVADRETRDRHASRLRSALDADADGPPTGAERR